VLYLIGVVILCAFEQLFFRPNGLTFYLYFSGFIFVFLLRRSENRFRLKRALETFRTYLPPLSVLCVFAKVLSS